MEEISLKSRIMLLQESSQHSENADSAAHLVYVKATGLLPGGIQHTCRAPLLPPACLSWIGGLVADGRSAISAAEDRAELVLQLAQQTRSVCGDGRHPQLR